VAGRRVLITGVGSFIGSSLAAELERDPKVEYVAGLDTRSPRVRLARTELVGADTRAGAIGRLLFDRRVDTVVHEQIVRRPGPGMSARAMHELNVMGTLQLLAACERLPNLEAIVIRGSAGIYGSEPNAPQFFTEEMTSLYPLRSRFQRDVAEIETMFAAFSRRQPRVVCTMLRYQPAVGPSLDSQFTRYLSSPAPPTYLGFDPRLQVIHEHDAVAALVATIERPVEGAVNVAGAGTIGLTRMIRLAGRPAAPIVAPLFGAVTSAARRVGMQTLPDDFRRLLRYGRAVDTHRLTDEIGFTPRYSTVAAIEDWARVRKGHSVVPALRTAVAP
jgi:UDP-glucose 4-epimerase